MPEDFDLFAKTKRVQPKQMTESFRDWLETDDYNADESDWVHRSFEERSGHGRRKLKGVTRLGSTTRREPQSWGQDVKQRAYRTVVDAIKGRNRS